MSKRRTALLMAMATALQKKVWVINSMCPVLLLTSQKALAISNIDKSRVMVENKGERKMQGYEVLAGAYILGRFEC